MINIDELFTFIISDLEGGTLIHKNAGESDITFAGIYRAANPQWEGWKLIDERGYREGDIVNDPDIIALVAPFYRVDYYEEPGFGTLYENVPNDEFIALLVDCGVNSGPARAVRLAQKLCNQIFDKEVLTVDGALGPASIGALVKINKIDPDLLADAYLEARMDWYNEIIERNPAQERYRKGWLRRLMKLEDWLEQIT